jgi:hypothetical protein
VTNNCFRCVREAESERLSPATPVGILGPALTKYARCLECNTSCKEIGGRREASSFDVHRLPKRKQTLKELGGGRLGLVLTSHKHSPSSQVRSAQRRESLAKPVLFRAAIRVCKGQNAPTRLTNASVPRVRCALSRLLHEDYIGKLVSNLVNPIRRIVIYDDDLEVAPWNRLPSERAEAHPEPLQIVVMRNDHAELRGAI